MYKTGRISVSFIYKFIPNELFNRFLEGFVSAKQNNTKLFYVKTFLTFSANCNIRYELDNMSYLHRKGKVNK